MKFTFILIFFLQFIIGCSAQSGRDVAFKLFDKDSVEIKDAEVEVLTTDGDKFILLSDQYGNVKLKLNCKIGYHLSFYFKEHHTKKVKLMDPCKELESDTMKIYLESNFYSH